MHKVWKLASKGINNGLVVRSTSLLRETSDNLEFLETAWGVPNNLFMKNTDFSIKI